MIGPLRPQRSGRSPYPAPEEPRPRRVTKPASGRRAS